MAELEPGEVFAGHRIVGVAGRGGMGVVYRAIQLDLDRPVALKLIAAQLASDAEFRERFVRESRAAASIDHPNVIPIYYTGEHEGRPGAGGDTLLYIAMRYVEGADLRTLVRAAGRLEPARAARIVSQVGFALDAAHARGIVHRDVKPANVLLGPNDHAYLTDFGLTKRLTSGTGPTRSGGWVGTLGYVAPEQIRGEPVDARADVYALGCVLFHALTGHPPYRRDTDEATMWAHLNEPPPSVRVVSSDIPEGFEPVVRRALAKAPEARYQSAGDLARDVLGVVGERPPAEEETVASPSDSPTVPRTGPPPRPVAQPRRWWAAALALVPVIGLVIAGVVLLGGGSSAPKKGPGATTGTTTPAQPPANAAGAGTPKTFEVGGRPNDIVLTDKLAWVVRNPRDTLATVHANGSGLARYHPAVGPKPAAIAEGFGKVWVVNATTQSLVPVDVTTHRAGTPLALPPGHVASVATGTNAVWVGIRGNPAQALVRVNPGSVTIAKTVPIPSGVQDVTVGYGAVWVIQRRGDVVDRIDPPTGNMTSIHVGPNPQRITTGESGVWVTNSDGTLTRIDPGTSLTRQIPAGGTPVGVAAGGGAVWVANRVAGTLTRIDPNTFQRLGTVEVGGNPVALAIHGHSVWATDPPDGTVVRVPFK